VREAHCARPITKTIHGSPAHLMTQEKGGGLQASVAADPLLSDEADHVPRGG
jgi:hypothetical protein